MWQPCSLETYQGQTCEEQPFVRELISIIDGGQQDWPSIGDPSHEAVTASLPAYEESSYHATMYSHPMDMVREAELGPDSLTHTPASDRVDLPSANLLPAADGLIIMAAHISRSHVGAKIFNEWLDPAPLERSTCDFGIDCKEEPSQPHWHGQTPWEEQQLVQVWQEMPPAPQWEPTVGLPLWEQQQHQEEILMQQHQHLPQLWFEGEQHHQQHQEQQEQLQQHQPQLQQLMQHQELQHQHPLLHQHVVQHQAPQDQLLQYPLQNQPLQHQQLQLQHVLQHQQPLQEQQLQQQQLQYQDRTLQCQQPLQHQQQLQHQHLHQQQEPLQPQLQEQQQPVVAGSWKPRDEVALPWLQGEQQEVGELPFDVADDILLDSARVACVLDLRQMIGTRSKLQEELTELLMDYDILHPLRDWEITGGANYLFPDADSQLWHRLHSPSELHRDMVARVYMLSQDPLTHQLSWSGESHIHVGHHKLPIRQMDIQALQKRWDLPESMPNAQERQSLEMARLLALYGSLDNPLSHRRSGCHLALDPGLRRGCDYELFASPMNAAVPNGCFASKWPHIEWRFGSMGSYPSVLHDIPVGSIVCANPPFTDTYLSNFAHMLAEMKNRYRLRLSVPVREAPWREKLREMLPASKVLNSYYDASDDCYMDLLHPTLLWEDPLCKLPAPWGRLEKEASYAKSRSKQRGSATPDLVTPSAPTSARSTAAASSCEDFESSCASSRH